MKKIILTLLVATLAGTQAMGDSYDALWKQADAMQRKDLPKSEMAVMERIIAKATAGKDYGHLLAAEMRKATLQGKVSPDSVAPVFRRMEEKAEQTKDPVLRAVWYATLGKWCQNNSRDLEGRKPDDYYLKALAQPGLLAEATTDDYTPLAMEGMDGGSFKHDLLHLVGFEADTRAAYQLMHDYYEKAGNRGAACLSAFKTLLADRKEDVREVRKSKYLGKVDSLIHVYRDIPEAGELAVEHYRFLEGASDASEADKLKYINYALNRWGKWSRMNVLRNAKARLTEPMFSLGTVPVVIRPGEQPWIAVKMRNLQGLTMTLSRLAITADNHYNVNAKNTYKLLKSKATPLTDKTRALQIYGRPDYEVVKDSVQLGSLPVGAYLMEVASSNANIAVQRHIFYVSDLALLSQQLPDDSHRHEVVSATTGQPVAGARIQKKADGNILISTDTDKYTPAQYTYLSRGRYYKPKETQLTGRLYTDRAIYRPGQIVHATAILFNNEKGIDAKALEAGQEVKLTLRDAKWKVVDEKTAKTDGYGTVSADFNLPKEGQNGQYCVQADKGGATRYFRVEEYKRPTFEVSFPKVNQKYAWGDTVVVKASAKTYAGVPVQGARVEYTVTRRNQLWWWGSRSADWEIMKGTGVTREDGTFDVEIPLEATPSEREDGFLRRARFYSFDVQAVVTDLSGESHEGEMSLPLGTKSTAFSTDLPKRIETDSLKTVTFAYRNSAGMEIAAPVRYRIDQGEWGSAASNTPIYIREHTTLASGVHELEAICEQDTLRQEFTLFGMKDTRPMEHTVHWYYQTSGQFPRDGKPVYLQVGSSEKDVYIVYSIIAGDKLIEKGAWNLTDSIVTLPFTYKEEYASGIVLNYCFVKEGKCYSNMMRIARPLPDKQLNVTWKTFRNRLVPGQKEEWTLNITTPDGKPAKAQLMSVLYDKSLDRLRANNWSLSLGLYNNMPSCNWTNSLRTGNYLWSLAGSNPAKHYTEKELDVDHFAMKYFGDGAFGNRVYCLTRGMMGKTVETFVSVEKHSLAKADANVLMAEDRSLDDEETDGKTSKELDNVQVRENLDETAFFYPALESDDNGDVAIRFTLPESVTTWKFMGLAHDGEMRNGTLVSEATAKKTVMVQPNMPRFLREGDKATVVAKVLNTSDRKVEGTARMQLLDPETHKVVWQKTQKYSIDANGTTTVGFDLQDLKEGVYINKVVVAGRDYSDGEQHYLPVLGNRETVTNTLPFTLTEKGTKDYDLTRLFLDKEGKPVKEGKEAKVTVEYTDNPAWLMIQALPSVANPDEDNAISQMAAIYSNSITRHFREYISDFDETQNSRLLSAQVSKLGDLQNGDGSFSWWKGMQGSRYMTTAVAEMMARLNRMVGVQENTASMLTSALDYLQKKVAEEVKDMKKAEKEAKARNLRPSEEAVNYLYILSLDGRKMGASATADVDYLVKKLADKTCDYTIYGKALTAVVLGRQGYRKKAAEYLQSINEYTVYKPEMGRYYDTRKAYYSWRNYRIPTQVAAIEAMQMLSADKMAQEISEMQLWLLQSKRTQAWDTPVNTVNAVYAFLNGNEQVLEASSGKTCFKLDGKTLEMPETTAKTGYVKTTRQGMPKSFSVDKKSDGTSWGAVYAQVEQSSSEVASAESGIRIVRKVSCGKNVKVGDKVKVTLEIVADRDYDFVQVTDKRAACLEPVSQLSGCIEGEYYISPRDNTTNYYFNRLNKGRHIVSTEYYVDRQGDYHSGTCTAQCTYSPEFGGHTDAYTLNVK